ncbi:32069_t:CDS:2, partial [Racocetra persica]
MNTNSANKYFVIPITQGTLEKELDETSSKSANKNKKIFLLDEDNESTQKSPDDNNKAKKELCKKLIRVDAIAKTLFAD